MIEMNGLTKRFGPKTAVDSLTLTVEPGRVTGFLGPNGAGKSTTMRLILGLDHPSAGAVTVNGRPYAASPAPITEVGALLDAKAAHPRRSARSHLLALAATHSIPARRVDEVIALTGLDAVQTRRVGAFSLGMAQRLGIAAALLGDPGTLLLDEPVNGLDPEGVAWVRGLVKHLAAEGRTVFLSSHLMSEMAQTADHLIILGRGRLIADSPIAEIIAQASGAATRLRSPQAGEIAAALASPKVSVNVESADAIVLTGIDSARVGEAAARHGWVLHELAPVVSSLETAYLGLTEDAVEFRSQDSAADAGAHPGASASPSASPSAPPFAPPVPPGQAPGATDFQGAQK
ncbi:MAG: ATP-binding cassette domain-containing protein [Bifidobacteriaceae bacterium]|jgi:ABC-2 type transport system ATP-binding protein|nr:ATP-binding cassette domain-containing protein [Bifidobacteriaceae bacterium]